MADDPIRLNASARAHAPSAVLPVGWRTAAFACAAPEWMICAERLSKSGRTEGGRADVQAPSSVAVYSATYYTAI